MGAIILSDIGLAGIVTYWFLNAQDCLTPILVKSRATFESEPESGLAYWPGNRYLALAIVSAAEGDTEEAGRLVRVWQREASTDLADLANLRHCACRALGMAAATSVAVECNRSGLVEPSQAMPFVEPYQPYYDSIRDLQAFVDLLTEIQVPIRTLY